MGFGCRDRTTAAGGAQRIISVTSSATQLNLRTLAMALTPWTVAMLWMKKVMMVSLVLRIQRFKDEARADLFQTPTKNKRWGITSRRSTARDVAISVELNLRIEDVVVGPDADVGVVAVREVGLALVIDNVVLVPILRV